MIYLSGKHPNLKKLCIVYDGYSCGYIKGGTAYEDPILTIDGKTLIFKCTIPDGFDIDKIEGFAVAVVNQELGLTGEGPIYEASEVLE
ncbi:MAG: hypothetical protein ACERKN_18525 [Velocimicrobium sp.]